jgi:hypothetical protein
MLVDTDVLIWNLRGNERAAVLLDDQRGFCISAVTYMELVQGLRNKAEFRQLRQAIRFWEATIIHVTEAISARASYLVEAHALASALQLADALIAATALETGLTLISGNVKHYRKLEGVSLQPFSP